jgi:hypothetical protein
MRHPGQLTASLALLVLAAGTGAASDHVVAGKKLLLKTPATGAGGNRIVSLGTGAAIAVGPEGGAGDPRCVGAGGGGASLRVVTADGGETTIALPCHHWSLSGSKTTYSYKDTSGTTCNRVLVRAGALVKAVCKGPQLALDVGPGMAPVTVIATLNTDQFCAEYGGTVVHDGSDGAKLLHKDAPAPASCPTTTTTSTTPTVETTSTTLACCILYAGQCTWTTSEYACILLGGAAIGEPGSVCDGVTGGCTPVASPGYCCAYPDLCTSGPTGDPLDCVEAGGTVHSSAICTPDGACSP